MTEYCSVCAEPLEPDEEEKAFVEIVNLLCLQMIV